MAITRATNLAGLGTVFDALTDGGGLSLSGISTFKDLLFVGSGSTSGIENQPLQVIGDAYISGSIGLGTTGSRGTIAPTNKLIIYSDSLSNATTSSPLAIVHPKNTIGLYIGDFPQYSVAGYGQNDYASTIRFNGSEVAWGDISYYPKPDTRGHFRFTRSGTSVDTAPTAIVGVGTLYAASAVGVGTTRNPGSVSYFKGNDSSLGILNIANHYPYYGGSNFTTGNLYVGTQPGYNARGLVSRIVLSTGDGGQTYLESIAMDTGGTAADFAISTRNNSAPTEKLRVTYDGKVGIGTTNPSVFSTSADDFVVATDGNTGVTIKSGSSSTGALYFANANGPFNNSGGLYYDHSSKGLDIFNYGTPSYTTVSFNASEKIRFLYNGGITFNGDTATANALDDYEEGTFTGTLNWHTDVTNTSTTNASSNHTGYYLKIGSLVYFFISTTSSATANYVYKSISGLPFTVATAGSRGNIRVRGGRMRYSGTPVTDCLFYSAMATTTAGLNAEAIGSAFSGWIEVVAASQDISVWGTYHTF